MHWLAEQGLAIPRVFLVIVLLIIFIVVEVLKNREDKRMDNRINTIVAPNDLFNVIGGLSGNMAGGALLTNAFYEMILRDTG